MTLDGEARPVIAWVDGNERDDWSLNVTTLLNVEDVVPTAPPPQR
ncbi:hypothetical protein ACIBP6_35870 [Nonomuraea terrae]